jgi:ABC-2 type transport system ATP-binding protein
VTTDIALQARDLGKRYRQKWAVRDCSFQLPAGRVAALVGPNGAGKSTLLRMAAGLTRPTTGSIEVFGGRPADVKGGVLARVGYLDQERPLYKHFRVAEILRLGRELNAAWDQPATERYLSGVAIPLDARVGSLSVGQQAQVALTLCIAKQPDLLLLDEPAAALDPLARVQLLQLLLDTVAERGTTVLLSSHSLADLENTCDYLIILSRASVLVAGDLQDLRDSHRLMIGPREPAPTVPGGAIVVSATDAGRQTNLMLRYEEGASVELGPGCDLLEPTLEEIVLAYLRQPGPSGRHPLSMRVDSSRNDDFVSAETSELA